MLCVYTSTTVCVQRREGDREYGTRELNCGGQEAGPVSGWEQIVRRQGKFLAVGAESPGNGASPLGRNLPSAAGTISSALILHPYQAGMSASRMGGPTHRNIFCLIANPGCSQ